MKKTNKGVTLVELCIVIGLLSIVAVLVLSFTTLMQNYTKAITSDNAVIEDLNNVDDVMSSWISFFDSNKYMIKVNEDNTSLEIYEKNDISKNYNLKYYSDNNMIIGTYFSNSIDRKLTYYAKLNNVESLKFDISENNLNDYLLIKCVISYSNLNAYGTDIKKYETTILHTSKAILLYEEI